jgi:hypothetical protein
MQRDVPNIVIDKEDTSWWHVTPGKDFGNVNNLFDNVV